MNNKIYGILDTMTGDFVGNLILMRHDNAAMRLFADVAVMEKSPIHAHPQDYNLLCMGELTDNNEIVPEKRIVLSGEQWAASQRPQLSKEA